MEIRKEKSIALNVPAAAAWDFLQDVPAVAACMPGAKITERIGDDRYAGAVQMKIGPVAISFNGIVEIKQIDAQKRTLVLQGAGRDGSSAATMELASEVKEAGTGQAEVTGRALINVNGKVVTLAGRMLNTIADRIIDEFAKNFADGAAARASAAAVSDAGSPAGAWAPVAPRQGVSLLAIFLQTLWQRIRSAFGRGAT